MTIYIYIYILILIPYLFSPLELNFRFFFWFKWIRVTIIMYKDTTNTLGICLFLLHYFKTLLKILNLIMHSQWEKQQGFQNILKFFCSPILSSCLFLLKKKKKKTSILMSHERSGSKFFCILVLTCNFVEFYQFLRYIFGVLDCRKKKIGSEKFFFFSEVFGKVSIVLKD